MILSTLSSWSTRISDIFKVASGRFIESTLLRRKKSNWNRHTPYFLLRKTKEWTVVFPFGSLCSRSGNYLKYPHDLKFLKLPSYFFIAGEPFKPRSTMKRDLSHIKDTDSTLHGCFKTTLPRSGAVLSVKNYRTGLEHHDADAWYVILSKIWSNFFTL